MYFAHFSKSYFLFLFLILNNASRLSHLLTVAVSITNCCDVMEYFLRIMRGTLHFLVVVNFASDALSCALSIDQMISNPLCFLPCKIIIVKCSIIRFVGRKFQKAYLSLSSFESTAANAFTTAFIADSSGLLISSSSFCDIKFGFLPILFNLTAKRVK